MQKREVTVDSCSETISTDSSSDDRTITADPEESSSSMEDNSYVKETNSTDIEASLHQIASGSQHAAEGYMSLASHISKLNPYELPQLIAQILPPPIDVPIPIRKALTIDGESKTVNYLCYVGQYGDKSFKISLSSFGCLGVIIPHFILCTVIHNCSSSGSLFFTSLMQNN